MAHSYRYITTPQELTELWPEGRLYKRTEKPVMYYWVMPRKARDTFEITQAAMMDYIKLPEWTKARPPKFQVAWNVEPKQLGTLELV